MEYGKCIVCGGELDFEPQMCCSGKDCGCMGLPIDPPICSEECWEKFYRTQSKGGVTVEKDSSL